MIQNQQIITLLSYALRKAKIILRAQTSLIVCGDPKKEEYRKITIRNLEKFLFLVSYARDIDKCIEHPKK
jgi:CO dehydrogenase/acetyl-CoA synthase epsilon subunit